MQRIPLVIGDMWQFFRGLFGGEFGAEPIADDDPRPGEKMVRTQLVRRGITDERVLDAMTRLDRRRFVPARLRARAFDDRALPIDSGQTISQPFIVATMTQHLELEPHHRVLEIGTGSGYQAAVLGMLCREVISVERLADLSVRAEEVLRCCGIANVRCVISDGSQGWPDEAPYDRIIVTAAARRTSKELLQQLSPDGGILVGPEGPPHLGRARDDVQTLRRWRRHGEHYDFDDLMDVRFVPLIEGEDGPRRDW